MPSSLFQTQMFIFFYKLYTPSKFITEWAIQLISYDYYKDNYEFWEYCAEKANLG